MEMHQLRYVVAVARAGNFSRAAEQCHVSQPSLSQQIQKLEAELGERLFDRMRREARLTRHGETFLARAVRILDEVESARREASDAKEAISGVLRLGVLPTIAPYLLPRLLPAFTKACPRVEVIIEEDTTERLARRLLACEIEVALASEPFPEDRTDRRELFSEELLLALPPGHRLARRRSVPVDALEQERFIVMKEGHCLGDQVLQFCARRDLQANVSFRSAQLETIQALVRAGLGVSLVPAMAAAHDGDDPSRPVYRPIEGLRPRRSIIAAWARQRPPGRAAAELLKAAA